MIDGGLIAGYLAAAAARQGARVLDRTVDAALDRLAAVVAGRLGPGPSEDLERDPHDQRILNKVGGAVQGAASRDVRFENELARLQLQLLQIAGTPRNVINQMYSGIEIRDVDGNVHVGPYYEGDSYSDDYDPGDELVIGRGAGRALAVLGLMVALAGFGGWIFSIFTFMGDNVDSPLDVELVPGVPLAPVAFGAFLIGGLVYGLGTTMSKAARKRQEEQRRRRGRGQRYRR